MMAKTSSSSDADVAFDVLFWGVAPARRWDHPIPPRSGLPSPEPEPPLSSVYRAVLGVLAVWHLGLLWRRYVRGQERLLLAPWQEAVSVCMGAVVVAYAVETCRSGRCMAALGPLCVGTAIVIAHGRRLMWPEDVVCYYWC